MLKPARFSDDSELDGDRFAQVHREVTVAYAAVDRIEPDLLRACGFT